MFECIKCSDHCQVATQNPKTEGKRSEQPALCVNCRFGINGHKKMAKARPQNATVAQNAS